jgi:recombination protein RecT
MGYRGYIQLALRTGQYERINAFPVNIEALAGFDDVGEPVIDFDLLDDTKEAVGYAIVWKLTNGFRKCVYWSRCRVERHGRRYSRAFRGRSSLWKSNFDDMALKTVIAHGLKRWGILSIEMQQAFRHDQGAQVDIDAEITHPDGAGDLPEIERGRVGADPAASGLFDDPAGEQVEPEQIPA